MATIRKRTLPSGKTVWLAGYIDGAGKRRFRQFPTKKEADGFLTRARSEVASGVHVPDSQSMTVGQAADEWLRSAEEAELERSTLVHYRAHVNEHIRPLIGSLKLTQVTTPRVYAFADELKAQGRSQETIRRSVQSLGRVFRYAKGRGLAGQNPVADVKLRRSKRDAGRVEIPIPNQCTGEVRGTALKLDTSTLRLRVKTDEPNEFCEITVHYNGDRGRVQVTSENCGHFHGPSCDFGGTLKRR